MNHTDCDHRRGRQWIAPSIVIILSILSGCSAPSGNGVHALRQRSHSLTVNNTTPEDIKAEITFGRDIAARVLGRFILLKDKQRTRYVNLIGTALANQAARGELNYYFAILDSDSINAYSAPGGYIFITHGALSLAEDEAELAAILAHEIAHVTERQIVNALNIRAVDSGGSAGLGRLLSASSDTAHVAFAQAAEQAVTILFKSGYSQQDELDADRIATLMLANSGFDPLALRRYLQRAQGMDNKDQEINLTHPPADARLTSLDRLIAEEKFNGLNQPRNTQRFKRHVKNP